MEYVTAESFNNFLTLWRTFWVVFTAISMMWCTSSIIIDLVKMYTFKDEKKEIFKSIFSILKTLVYIIPIGMFTLITSEVYNDSFNIDLVFKGSVAVVAIVAILISIIYKKYNKKNLKTNNSNEESNLEKEDI